jgi:hypothetical protein
MLTHRRTKKETSMKKREIYTVGKLKKRSSIKLGRLAKRLNDGDESNWKYLHRIADILLFRKEKLKKS